MRRRLAALALAVAILTGLGAHVAEAAVPYSWFCYRGSSTVHVYTPGGVGYWAARGHRCYGGFWRFV